MKNFAKLALVAVVALAAVCSAQTSTTQKRVDNLRSQLSDGTVSEIQIFAVPKDMFVKQALAPEVIEKEFRFQARLRDMKRTLPGLNRALDNTSVDQEASSNDFRRVVLFIGHDGKPINEVDIDRYGRASLRGDRGSMTGEFVQWVEDRIPADYW